MVLMQLTLIMRITINYEYAQSTSRRGLTKGSLGEQGTSGETGGFKYVSRSKRLILIARLLITRRPVLQSEL